MTPGMRSDVIKKGNARAPHRSLLRATGQIRDARDFDKPFIAICNSYCDIIPGHVHLQAFGRVVKDAVRAAGGIPFEFNTIGVDDGIVMGHDGMRYSLPSRELIADAVETMIAAHCFDAMICIPNCDKIVPGMLMGAARVESPTVFISGGPMRAGVDASGNKVDLITVFEGVGKPAAGEISDAQLLDARRDRVSDVRQLQRDVHRQLDELPVRGARRRAAGERDHPRDGPAARRARAQRGAPVDALLDEATCASRDIVTSDAIDNAMALDVAMGGSTNTVLHVLALAHETGLEYPVSRFNEVAERVPHLAKISPAWDGNRQWHMQDVHAAGGVPAILAELALKPGALRLDARTVTGQTLGENLEGITNRNRDLHPPRRESTCGAGRARGAVRQPGARRAR